MHGPARTVRSQEGTSLLDDVLAVVEQSDVVGSDNILALHDARGHAWVIALAAMLAQDLLVDAVGLRSCEAAV